MLSLVMLLVLGIPLGLSLNNLLVQSNTRQEIWYLARHEMPMLSDAELQSLTVVRHRDGSLDVEMTVVAPANAIAETEVWQSQSLLEEELDRTVDLTMQVTPMQEFRVLSPDR